MTQEWRDQVREIFLATCGLPPSRRVQYLDDACAGFPELREEVESLLAHDPGGFPESIDGHTVLHEIGGGAMGRVFLVRRPDGTEAALKLLRPEVAEEVTRKRFERESRILRSLDHPGIARLLDRGTFVTGNDELPYFVMEFVRGAPITVYSRGLDLDTHACMALLGEVCATIHYAHTHGIVHRDLKPVNILVDSGGAPKVLDFGVAHVVGGDAQLASTLTASGMIVGSLGYMSPEQAEGSKSKLDPRSDIYALGMLAYELITGEPLFSLTDLTVIEALERLRTINLVERVLGTKELPLRVRMVLAKAVERDPSQRHTTAVALGRKLAAAVR